MSHPPNFLSVVEGKQKLKECDGLTCEGKSSCFDECSNGKHATIGSEKGTKINGMAAKSKNVKNNEGQLNDSSQFICDLLAMEKGSEEKGKNTSNNCFNVVVIGVVLISFLATLLFYLRSK